MRASRGDVFLVSLDQARGREIRKARPCVVVSPDELNGALSSVVVAPMTTGGHAYPFRIACRFQKRAGFVVLDQLRTVDTNRLLRHLGRLSAPTQRKCLAALREMFAE
jgi:mRNA interferase MazF